MMKHATIVIALFCLLFAHASRAAVVSFLPSATGTVSVMMDTQGESVNAVEIHATFDPREFSVAGISDGGSVIDLWVERPAFSNDAGTLDLSGIIPGGVDTTHGMIATIALVPRQIGISKGFSIVSASVLLNDGKGTAASLSITSGTLAFSAVGATGSAPAIVDTQAPDPFTPVISRDPGLFDGKYFLVFSATDGRSGMDHYEVLEGAGAWHTITSPYVLEDQTLSSDISVRAVDKAANFRVVKVPAAHPHKAVPQYPTILVILIGLGILGVAWFFLKRKI